MELSATTWRLTWARQDHTTSPSAPAPLVPRHQPVHRIPRHVRDDRDTPLVGAERGRPYTRSNCWKTEIFLCAAIDRIFASAPVGQITLRDKVSGAWLETTAIREARGLCPRHPEAAVKRPSRRATARLPQRGRSSFEAHGACHRAALCADPVARASSDKRQSRLRGDDGWRAAA